LKIAILVGVRWNFNVVLIFVVGGVLEDSYSSRSEMEF
jgi:hypothetical protein